MRISDWSSDVCSSDLIGVKGIERREAGLALARKQRLEAVVHIGQDRRAGTEIGGDRQDAVRVLRKIGIARPDIGADIGAAEAIDRLLGITDEEERAGPDREGAPVYARDPGRRLAARSEERRVGKA